MRCAAGKADLDARTLALVTVIVTKTLRNEPDMVNRLRPHGVVGRGQRRC